MQSDHLELQKISIKLSPMNKTMEEEIKQLLEQDSQHHLDRIAKQNFFNLFLYQNKFSNQVPQSQQYLAFKIAKEHSKDLSTERPFWLAFMLMSMILAICYFYNLSSKHIHVDNFILINSFLVMIIPLIVRYFQIRQLYKESLQTYLTLAPCSEKQD